MNKPQLVIISPLQTQSGYGRHAADIARSIIALDKFDVKLISLKWGDCPMNALIPGKDDDLLSRIVPQLTRQPEICVFVSIPNEFQPIGKYNIGITAGIEATVCPPQWIEGLNRMDVNIVPSEHSKLVFTRSEFIKNGPNNQPVGFLKLEKPMEIIFEGADTNVYKKLEPMQIDIGILQTLDEIKEDFVYLFVGHWLQGSLGNDRKDVGMTIKLFLDTFKNKKDAPALLLKTSGATFSVIDREEILKKISAIKSTYPTTDVLPNIYLLHGQLTDDEMNSLYNHPKVKCMVSLTKGEGYGRPLLEFSLTGKPIIASAWSGHVDFLDKEMSILLPGELKDVDASALNDFFIKGSKWFTADYNVVPIAYTKMKEEYDKYLSLSKKLMYQNKNKFSHKAMTEKFRYFFEKYVPDFPVEIDLKLPEKKDITLPKLQKIRKEI
jgi:hypothetical protein